MNVIFNQVAKLCMIFVNSKDCLELTEMNGQMVFYGVNCIGDRCGEIVIFACKFKKMVDEEM